MTNATVKDRPTVNINRIFLPIAALTLTVLFIFNAKAVSTAVIDGLTLCAVRIIPSVFPSTVMSGLLVASGGGELFGRLFGKPVSWIFGVSENAACAVLFGFICGFPVGAATAASLFRRGEIERDDIERLIGFIGLPSPAFVINAIGMSMFGSRKTGIILYLILLVISTLIGVAGGFVARKRRRTTSVASVRLTEAKKATMTEALVGSVASSTTAMLGICGYVVFFAAITSLASELSAKLNLPKLCTVLISGLFEFSGGCSEAANLGGKISLPIVAMFLGWSGFGVHFQTMSVCGELSYRKYYLSILVRGVVAFLAVWAVISSGFDI